jgi:hypothetical protein
MRPALSSRSHLDVTMIRGLGLGLQNVKYKALTSLIRTFLETSVHPSFQHSLLHTLLYRKYVFEDDSLCTPKLCHHISMSLSPKQFEMPKKILH